MGMEPIALISRDDDFIKISRKFITAQTPEEFLNALRR
jgi:hypothetical protein